MGLNEQGKGAGNGSLLCNICYKDGEKLRTVGSIIYYRSHEAEIRLDTIPIGLWKQGYEWLFGIFMKSEKVTDPPFIEGDITATTDTRGDRLKVGHITTKDDAKGDDVTYLVKMFGIPIGAWRKLIADSDAGNGRRSLYLKVEIK